MTDPFDPRLALLFTPEPARLRPRLLPLVGGLVALMLVLLAWWG